MLCQKCGERQASVFITQTVNGKTTQSHLCEVCATQEQSVLSGSDPFNVTINPSALFSNLFSMFPGMAEMMGGAGIPGPGPEADGAGKQARMAQAPSSLQCPHCGYQFQVFQQTGRLGCTQCYEAFREVLEPVLSGIHGNVRHVEEEQSSAAPVPPAAVGNPGDSPETASLRAKLKAAIEGERFEEAASLRDLIRQQQGNHS